MRMTVREALRTMRIYFMLARFANKRYKVAKYVSRMATYVVAHQDDFETDEGKDAWRKMYQACAEETKR